MLKVPSFGMNTCPEMFVPLMHCIIDYTLSLTGDHQHFEHDLHRYCISLFM